MTLNTSRAGAIALIALMVALLGALPDRYRVVPMWLVIADAGFVVIVLVGASLAAPDSRMRSAERPAALFAIALAIALNCLELVRILDALVTRPATLLPLPLFETSACIWTANIAVFAVAYWLIDAGGPGARAAGAALYYDFDFPARAEPGKVPPGWCPTIVDYFFIAFTANTAFGPTEAMPLTNRAKLLLVLQSIVSLVTIAVVGARAIGATG